jgi:hypothetical protein
MRNSVIGKRALLLATLGVGRFSLVIAVSQEIDGVCGAIDSVKNERNKEKRKQKLVHGLFS